MSTTLDPPVALETDRPQLENGAQLTRAEFHRLYEQAPPGFQAELVGGVVYLPSPLRRTHGVHHVALSTLFGVYVSETRGTEAGDNPSLLLGDDSEPQPDLYLRILPEFGGQSTTTADDYVAGPPELLVEIAVSSRSLDLHAKRVDYQRYGVREYVVVLPATREIVWFDLAAGRQHTLPADRVIRSQAFPGLWIDVDAVLAQDGARGLTTLRQGLASEEHAAFVARLATSRRA
jgi:Uma2 family endonuclease